MFNLSLNSKAENLFKMVSIDKSTISATDIANYSYCPVSYAISKSFTIIKPITAQIGTDFHEQHRLSNFFELRPQQDTKLSRRDSFKEKLKQILDVLIPAKRETKIKRKRK